MPNRKAKDPNAELTCTKIANELESIARQIVDAFNARDLSPDSPAWQHMAPNFRANPDYPMRQHLDPDAGDVSLDEFLQMARRFLSESGPDFAIEIAGMTTEILRPGQAKVTLITHPKDDGEFGLQHMAVLLFIYDEEKDRWLCVRDTALRGFG